MTEIDQKQFICIESSNSHVESSVKLSRNDEDLKVTTINAIVKNDTESLQDLDCQIETCSSMPISSKSGSSQKLLCISLQRFHILKKN